MDVLSVDNFYNSSNLIFQSSTSRTSSNYNFIKKKKKFLKLKKHLSFKAKMESIFLIPCHFSYSHSLLFHSRFLKKKDKNPDYSNF